MATRHKMTVSQRPTGKQSSSAERRAAQIAALSTKQAELKEEAAQRRLARDADKRVSPSRALPSKARTRSGER